MFEVVDFWFQFDLVERSKSVKKMDLISNITRITSKMFLLLVGQSEISVFVGKLVHVVKFVKSAKVLKIKMS